MKIHIHKANLFWKMSFAITVCMASVATAHDLAPMGKNETVQWSSERLSYMPDDPASASASIVRQRADLPPALQWVLVLPNKWPQGQVLRVCFQGGSDALRAKILKSAQTWFNLPISVTMDYGPPSGRTCSPEDSSEIRIGFDEPGYWSYVGNDSISDHLMLHHLTSMNFQNFDKAPPAEPRFTGIVLHEFGHALGFHHEHQNPAEGCDAEYNWPVVEAYYKKAYGWDPQMTRDNLKQLLANHSAYDWSTPDPQSNMVYGTTDPKLLYKGVKSPCYFHDNNVLSQLDKEGAEFAYGKTSPNFTSAELRQRSADVQRVLNLDIDQSLRSALEKQLSTTSKLLNKGN